MSPLSSETPGWYDRQYGDALDFGEGYAERSWYPAGIRNFSAAVFLANRGNLDTHAAGQWTAAWFDCLIEEREVSIIPRKVPQSVAACWNEAVVAHGAASAVPETSATDLNRRCRSRHLTAAPVVARLIPITSRNASVEPMPDRADDAAATVAKAARPQWRVGQLWQERKPFRNGLVRIEAITDHPETPVIGRCTRTGLVDCYGLNGAWESDGMFRQLGEVSDGDLVSLIEEARASTAVRRVG